MTPQNKMITWLHLSDLHFKHISNREVDDRREILEELWIDISDQIKRGLQPDFVVFTGDIAYSGKKEEYDLAERYFFQPLLEKIPRLPPDRVFVVPGNHDVNWDLPPYFKVEEMPYLKNPDETYNFLSEPRDRQFLFSSVMFAYESFIKKYFRRSGSGDRDMLENPLYAYVDTLKLDNGISIAFMGLNSAWWSAIVHHRMANQATEDAIRSKPESVGDENKDQKTSEHKMTDRGKLLVGLGQVRDAKSKVGEVDIRIALMHHPFEWLEEFDAREVRRELRRRCHFILRGHLHEPEFIREIAWENESVCVIPAGSIDEDRELGSGYSYNLVQIDLGKKQGKAHFRCFHKRNKKWYGEPTEFELPKELRTLADKVRE